MTLSHMRRNGVRAVIATCQTCEHKADVNVDALAETVIVPNAGGRSQPVRRASGLIRDPQGIRRDERVAALLHSPEIPWRVSPVRLTLKC